MYENLVLFYLTWSIMEVCINCCMFGKILEKFGFWDMCQNILANQIAGFLNKLYL